MTEEEKHKIRVYLHPIDGIEKTEEMIDSIEYLETNIIDEKAIIYLKWLEDKLEITDNSRNYYLQQTIIYSSQNIKLKLALTLSIIFNISLFVFKML
jgi:hypothetical protein